MNMNDNDKNIKDNAKNCKIPVPTKESICNSAHPRNSPQPFSPIESCQFHNKTREKTNLDVTTAMTKRLCHNLTQKVPQIHETGRRCHANKLCTEQLDNPTPKTARDEKNRTKRERKYSKLLVSDEKTSKSATRKHQSSLKTNRDTIIDDLNHSKNKTVPSKRSGESNLPRVKEAPCKTVLPLAKHVKQREYRAKDYYSKRTESPRYVSKESERVNRKQEDYYTRRYSEKIKLKDKIKHTNKQTDKNSDEPGKTKKISPQDIVEVKNTLNKKIVCSGNDTTANRERHGAARTRIFKRKKNLKVHKNPTTCKDGISKKQKEFRTEISLPTEKQDKVKEGNRISDSVTKLNCKKDSNNSLFAIEDDNIISLYDGSFRTPQSSINCQQQEECKEISVGIIEERADNNGSSTASSKTNCEQSLAINTEINLSRENFNTLLKGIEVCYDESISGKDEEELITDSISKKSDYHYQEIRKSLTIDKIPAVTQDEIIYHTNLLNYGYNSGQQYCKRSNKQRDFQHNDGKIIKLSTVDKIQSTDSDDAKYNLIRALIQPVTEIHNFKSTNHNVEKLLPCGRRSEHVMTCKGGELQKCNINSISNECINKEIVNASISVIKQFEDNTNKIKSSETWNPDASEIYLKQPLSNTSDHIALNLKMKNSRHVKKYRHFKHEGKNMCCNMARYIQRMVSNEKKHQEFEKKENPKKEKVKIIIDENTPKTSKVRIVNDRSSISVVCHSLRRLSSSSDKRNDTMANKVESSGGESSGYKSFHNNFNTRNVDGSDQVDITSKTPQEVQNSAIIMSHIPRNVHNQDYNFSTHYENLTETFYDKNNSGTSRNTFNPFYTENTINAYEDKTEEDSDSQQNMEMKYSSYDTKNYLSTFTNCMDVHLPCEITAYQVKENNRSRILRLNNKELVEKDVDNAELHIGKYLTEKNSDSEDSQRSEGEESSKELGTVEDFPTAEDGVIILKEPDNTKYESLEFVVNERLLDPDNLEERTNSTNISTVPAQYRIVTSLQDLKPDEINESLERPTNASHLKFATHIKESTTVIKSNNGDIKTNSHATRFPPVPQVATNNTNKRLESRGTSCSGRFKNCNERADDSNAVHELWANNKSSVDSTDNDSQSSGRSCCGKSDFKKYNTNKLKFNMFGKSKPSAGERSTCIPLDQLPKPPPSFLETSASSQSTILSLIANTSRASESDIATNSYALSPPIIRTHSLTKSHADNAPVHYSKKTYTDSVHNQSSASIIHRESEHDLKSSNEPQFDTRSFVKPQELHPAVPPPASALPPPYPFCCPLLPYMMEYWQNNQQPPPASTVPLPEVDWKPNVSMTDSAPPPPGMVPIPWFPPMRHLNNPPQGGPMDTRMFNNLHPQPPPEWFMMPKYAPCLPCSKTLESHLGKSDSLTFEDDEPTLETSESKQYGKKKRVSNKLFKIFKRKNRADVETLEEDDKRLRVRYQHSRSDDKPSNARMVENDEGNLDDHSIWESPDIAGIVTPEEIGRCFRRGFRADGLTLSGDDYVFTKTPSDTTPEHEDVFNFSDHDTPLDFLLALGFSVDEATAAIRDDEVKSRFKAALTEARIWVPHIATTQGTLLYLLAMKAKPKVMRYFLQLVESIVNKRITNAVKLDAYLKILEKVEDGYVSFVTLFGKDTGTEDEEDTLIVEKQRRRIFYTIYKYAESEAKEVDRPLTKVSVTLLHSLAARYRPAIGPHLRLLACYIGEGLLTKDVQLEAAVIYLSRLDSAYVQLADLEKYCGLPRSERRRAEQIEKPAA